MAVLVTTCTVPTQVHVFSLGVEKAQVEAFVEQLDEAGFAARAVSLPVPASINRHTIIYPAIVQDFAVVDQIESAMAQAGYPDSRLIRETEANHIYSTENIGVYLVNPDYDPIAAADQVNPYALGDSDASGLSYLYYSECPQGSEAQFELSLFPSGVAVLEEFYWDEEQGRERTRLFDGEWQPVEQSLTLELFELGTTGFSISRFDGEDRYGPFEGLMLIDEAEGLAGKERCNFGYKNYLYN